MIFLWVMTLTTGLWLGMTLMLDFFVLPTVFRTLTDVFVAGRIGMSIFTKFNIVELLFSCSLVCAAYFWGKNSDIKKNKFLGAGLFLLALVAFFTFFLTPKISMLALQLSHAKNLTASSFVTFQEELATYHKLYVRLDGLKIILQLTILGFIFMLIRKKETV
ncbi:MAG: DUF4149 domain-containing protein [Bacteriovoracaceae bacterium]|nr:DUF4149 domain-containing protein [Bacteriovoracaceae bacterium]